MTKIVLSVAGLDPSGGAGSIADIKTIAAFGCFPAAAITSITFQNTTGVFGVEDQTAETVRRQIEPVLQDYRVDALKTGMLPSREIIGETASQIEIGGLKNIVVDPVVRSTSGFDLIDDRALAALIEKLFPLADVITPNIPEAERISGFQIRTVGDIDAAAAKMQQLGARCVLIKGGHGHDAKSGTATDRLYMSGEVRLYSASFIETDATHGTGCTLSAAIAANLALGREMGDAVSIAKDFVHEAIRTAPHIGAGHSPINIKPAKTGDH